MPSAVPRFKDALDVLARHQVRFIVVGGVAAVIAGAPVSTFDLDIVHDRSADNLVRLEAALKELDARYRDPGGRVIRPDAQGLSGPGHHLLVTTAGPVDVLGSVHGDLSYAELLGDSTSVALGDVTVAVLGLDAVIRLKEMLGRDKDHATLAILRRTLEETRK